MTFGKMIFGALFVTSLTAVPAMAQRASVIGGGARGSVSSINGITQGPDGVPYYAGRSVAVDPFGAGPISEEAAPYAQAPRERYLQDDNEP